MGEVEEVQGQMKADMEAMKEKMVIMMESMMSMKKIMEANAVAVATTNAVAKTHEMPHHNLADFEPCLGYATERQAIGDMPLQNTLEGPQYHPQPHLLHSIAGKNPHAMAEMGKWRDLAAPPMTEKEMITIIVDTLPMFYYEKWLGTHLQVSRIWSSPVKGSKWANLIILVGRMRKLGQMKRVRMKEKPMLRLLFLHENFPPAKQCHCSANISPSHYPPSTITPTKVPQPPFLRGYDSNTMCACHGEAPGHSIKHCMTSKCKV
ncbi:hypothetical protein HKD37_20G056326 [Glycine soja]